MKGFRSKAQIQKFQELVQQKKMSQDIFDAYMRDTTAPHLLPDKIGKKATTPGRTKPVEPTPLTWYPKIHTRIGGPKKKR